MVAGGGHWFAARRSTGRILSEAKEHRRPDSRGRRAEMATTDPMDRHAGLPADAFAFVWKDFSRYVEVHPVQTGWLVVWGRYEDQGQRKLLLGNRTYPTLAGARR